jgi:hypothetical protein
LEQVVLDGFFARTSIGDVPRETRAGGLQEFGLPYAFDPVVSKHIARFLGRSLQNVKASEKLAALVGVGAGTEALIPTAVLFNGGVFKAAAIRARVLDLLASWNGGQPVRELQGFEPDLAVALGAAIYGRHRATGRGIRIKAGAARSYYIGLETSMPAIPGYKPPVKALCVVPQGMQEGTELLIEGREFGPSAVEGRHRRLPWRSSTISSRSRPAARSVAPAPSHRGSEAGFVSATNGQKDLQGDFDKMEGEPTHCIAESQCAVRSWKNFSLKRRAGRS